ncbi:MAG: hypothetical protein QM599_04275 [Pseudoxanthomonas sp.]
MTEIFAGMNKQEKIAILALAVTCSGIAYLMWQLFFATGVLASGTMPEGVRDNVAKLFAVLILGFMLIRNFGSGPLEDERDRQVKAKGMEAGYFALVLQLVVTGVAVGSDAYASYIGSRSSAWLEMYLLLCIAVSVAANYAVKAFHYWRDRR